MRNTRAVVYAILVASTVGSKAVVDCSASGGAGITRVASAVRNTGTVVEAVLVAVSIAGGTVVDGCASC